MSAGSWILGETWFCIGNRRLSRGRLEPARTALDHAVRRLPRSAPARIRAGVAAWHAGDADAAAAFFARARTVAPENPAATLFHALFLLDRGRPAEARDRLEPVARDHPENSIAHAALGLAVLRAGDERTGLELLDRHLDLASPLVQSLFLVTAERRLADRLGSAEVVRSWVATEEFEKRVGETDTSFVDAIPGALLRWIDVARLTRVFGLERLRRRGYRGPLLDAATHQDEGRYEVAIRSLNRALELGAGARAVRFELARCRIAAGRFGDALRTVREMEKAGAAEAETALARGVAELGAGRPDQALPALEKSAAETREPFDRMMVALALLFAGKDAEARAAFEGALASDRGIWLRYRRRVHRAATEEGGNGREPSSGE